MKNTLFIGFLTLVIAACHPAQNCVEKPKPDCICTMQYDPVCGCNNKTYGNACMAACAGIKSYVKGECKQTGATGLEGRTWVLATFDSGAQAQDVPDNIGISVKFDNGKIDGNGGCNHVGGGYTLSGNSLNIKGLLSTKMFCEAAAKWETMFLQRLEKSKTYKIEGEVLEIDCGDMGQLTFRAKS